MKKLCLVTLSILITFFLSSGTLYALPQGEQVESGTASFERPNDTTLNITVNNATVINFNSFNIAQNEVVNFNPSNPALAASTNVLSRVSGPDPSFIAGTLNANLNLYLVNTNGIHFASTAQVNVNNLVASTLDISTNNFIRGNYEFEQNMKYSQILNEGLLTGNNIALIGSAVCNGKTGVIMAKAGTVTLASGDKITVSFDMRGLMNVEVNEKTSHKVIDMNGNTVKDAVANAGRIEATQVMMSARTVDDIFENAVNNTGIVKATGIVEKDGVIRIVANGNINVDLSNTPANIEINRLDQNISIGACTRVDDIITIEGNGLKVTYMVTSDFTLRTDNSIDTTSGAILQGNRITLIANKFGNTVTPLNIDSPDIHIKKLDGDIDILQSTGIGTSLQITGPPDGFGKIIYPKTSSLVLEAARISISTGVILSASSVYLTATGTVSINGSTIDASNDASGSIEINARNILQQGTLLAGNIHLKFTDAYIDGEGSLTSTRGRGGSIHLDGSSGLDSHIFASGEYDAAGVNGGSIIFEAVSFVKLYGTMLDASGSTNGGSIKIGGDLHGQGAMSQSLETVVNASASLEANGGTGIGGSIVVWSNQTTRFDGTARAASIDGNGGTIEISSSQLLSISESATVDASSVNGIDGAVLFDPKNIIISTDVTDPTGAIYNFEMVDPNPDTGTFGTGVTALTSGNIVVIDSLDDFAATDAGAVYLFNGATGALISTLTGSTANDHVGINGATALTNGNYVVNSPDWDNGAIVDAGAVTWGNGTTGIAGAVSTTNSLYGTTDYDAVSNGITALSNGNYVVMSMSWDNGAIVDAGAVTWGNGTTGIAGAVSTTNSLYGSTASDQVGAAKALTNGNYVVSSINWDNGAIVNAGAATWGNGTTGTTGAVSTTNSLYGSTANDQVSRIGLGGIAILTNGNYVVGSPYWDNGGTANVGAVTWGNGTTGTTGAVSTANSLYGTTAGDQVSYYTIASAIRTLTNGNYVVTSPWWHNGGTADVGAVTWGNGTTGTTGAVSDSNSLVGSTANDYVGSGGATALSNGNYVVLSAQWDNGAVVNAGAVTWGDGAADGTRLTGAVSTTNSLVGSTTSDAVGTGVTALTNGNYVVRSTGWDNGGTVNVGAVTWGDGATNGTRLVGAVSTSNSLYGSTASDQVGTSVTALTNGNYVVLSSVWDNGAVVDAGAVTWGNGAADGTRLVGAVSTTNSLYGSTASDYSDASVIALTNGNYVARSYRWDNGAVVDAGAVTWGNGATGTTGAVSDSNSLVGSTTSDQVGTSVTALTNGNYAVRSANWDNGGTANAGAATLGNGASGTNGIITTSNSIIGPSANAGLGVIVTDTVNSHFIAPFATAQKVYSASNTIFSSAPNDYLFAYDSNATYTLTPSFLTAVLNTGTNVTMQANNNITISNNITVNNPDGNGGALTFQAGRSILINANITTDNGNLSLYANEKASAGVIDANRSSGTAVITMAGGTAIDAGSGTVTIRLDDGAGNTYYTAGDITLTAVTAATISVTNTNSGGAIITGGALTATGAGNDITLFADTMTLGVGTTLTGSDSILIKPYTTSTTIGVGAGTGTTNLSDTELGYLSWGNSGTLTIGSITAGDITINTGSTILNKSVTFLTAGNISLATTALTHAGANTATLTMNAYGNIATTSAITASTSALTILLYSDYDVSGAGSISIGAGVASNGGTITIRGGGGTISTVSAFDNLTINTVGTLTLGAELNVTGGLTITNGTLTTANFAVNVGGGWSNSGLFNAGTGTVTLTGAAQSISGFTTFYNLTKTVATADTLTFTAGSIQTIAAGGKLTLRGAASNLLTLASTTTSPYTITFTNATSKYVVDYASVSYSTATGQNILAINSTNGNNNTGWTFPSATTGTLRYWVAGTTANWNDTANWSATSGGTGGSSVPTTTSDAIFDGNGIGDCTVNAIISVKGMYFAGYTGTISQGSNAITIGENVYVVDSYAQGTGVFTGSETGSAINVNGAFILSGGTFTATAGTLTFSATGNTALVISGGTFNHNEGTVVTTMGHPGGTWNVGTSLTLKNFTINNTHSKNISLSSGNTIIVTGALILTEGGFYNAYTGEAGYPYSGTINAKGTISIAATFDGGTGILLIDGDNSQSFTIPSGTVLPAIKLNQSGTTIDFAIGASASVTSYLEIDSGIFIAPSGTLTMRGDGGVGSYLGLKITGGTFTHNDGTVTAAYGHPGRTWDVNSILTLRNLTVANTSSKSLNIASGDTIVTEGALILTDGNIYGGTIQAKGSVSVGVGFDGGDSALQFTGSSDTTFANNGGTMPSGTMTISKDVGKKVTLNSALSVNSSGQDLVITSGTLDLNGNALTVNDQFTIGSSGTLALQGGETINKEPTSNTGTVEYNATSSTRDIKNWTYTNATVKINGTGGTFTLPADLTCAGINLAAGTLDSNSHDIILSGNWANNGGSFTYGTRTVTLTGTNQKILGATTFYNLTKDISAGSSDVLMFQNSNTQAIAANGTLTLTGAVGKILTLRSCDAGGAQTDGVQWGLNVSNTGTTLSVTYVDVKDSDASTGKAITATNSADSGNNLNWSGLTTSRYWVGGTGNWSDSSHWTIASGGTSGFSAPIVTSDVYFDANSGNGTATVDTVSIAIKSINVALAYTGTIDFTINNPTVAVENIDLSIGGKTALHNMILKMGSGVWTISGNWDSGRGQVVQGTAKVVFTGTGKIWKTYYNSKTLYQVEVQGSITTSTYSGYAGPDIAFLQSSANNALLVKSGATLTINTATIVTYGSITVEEGGVIDGSGTLTYNGYTNSVLTNSGTLSVAALTFGAYRLTIVPGTFNSANVTFGNWASSWYIFQTGTYTFAGNVTVNNTTMTLNYSTANANYIFQGNLTISGSTPVWNKGAGTITLGNNASDGTQTINFAGKSVEDIIVNGSGDIKQLTGAVTTDSLTITAGTLDLNGNALTVNDQFTIGSSGTLALQGGETINKEPTSNTGTVEYNATSSTRDIKNWTYTNATVKINGTGGTFTLPADLTCAGINLAAGTLDSNSHDIILSGNWANNGGSFTYGTRTVTFNGTAPQIGASNFNNLTIDAGIGNTATLTGSIAIAGSLTISSGSLDATTNLSTVDYNKDGAQTVTSISYYNLTVSGSGTKTISSGTTISNTGTISGTAKVLLTVSALVTGGGKEYDGNATASVTLSGDSIFTSYLNLTYNYVSATFDSKDVGDRTVTVSTISLDGIDKDRYELSSTTAYKSASITKKGLTAALKGTISKEYDGNNTATLNNGNYDFTGLVGTEMPTMTKLTGTYTGGADVGSSLTVSTTLAEGDFTDGNGFKKGNYTLPTSAAYSGGAITKKGLTAALKDTISKEYDGNNTATFTNGNYDFTGLVGTEMPTMTKLTGTYTAGADVGSSLAVSTTLVEGDFTDANGFKKGNYTLPTSAAYAGGAITKKGLTAALKDTISKEYDGNNTATFTNGNYDFTGLVGTEMPTMTKLTGTYTAGADVGSSLAVSTTLAEGDFTDANGFKKGNYTLPTSAAYAGGAITKKGLTAALKGTISKEYDGNNTATFTNGNYDFTGLVGTEMPTMTKLTGTYTAGADVGSSLAVSTTLVEGDFTDANGFKKGNYTLPTSAAYSGGAITKKGLTAALKGTISKEYDGNNTATFTNGNYDFTGLVGTEMPTMTKLTGTYTGGADVGSSLAVSTTLVEGDFTDANGFKKGNYTLPTSAAYTGGAITKKGLTAALKGTISKEYDGNNTATFTNGNYDFTGLVGTEMPTMTKLTGTYTAGADVGSSLAVSTTLVEGDFTDANGFKKGNYTLPTSAAYTGGAITKKGLTAALKGTISKEYDGNNTATLNNGNYDFTGLVGTEMPTMTKLTGAYTAGADVGSSLTVSTTLAEGDFTDANGFKKGNYTLPTSAAYSGGAITKKGLTAALKDTISKEYDGNNTATFTNGNYDFTGLVGTEMPTMTKLTGTYTGGKNAGSSLTVSTTLAEGDFTDGNGFKKGNYNLPTNAGYSGGVITKRTTIITGVAGVEREYDGSLTATAAFNSAIIDRKVLNDSLDVDSASYSASFANKNVGTGKNVAITGITLSGSDNANYLLTAQPSATATITARATTALGITGENKVYDGTTNATINITGASIERLVAGDSLSLVEGSGFSARFADANVGTGKTIEISGLALNGGDKSNYAFSQPMYVTANITGIVPSPTHDINGRRISIQELDQLYMNPFLSTGGMGTIMATPGGGVVIVAAPIVPAPMVPAAIAAHAIIPLPPAPISIVTPEAFAGVNLVEYVHTPAKFEGLATKSIVSSIITPDAFTSISFSARSSEPMPRFDKITVKSTMGKVITPESFSNVMFYTQAPGQSAALIWGRGEFGKEK